MRDLFSPIYKVFVNKDNVREEIVMEGLAASPGLAQGKAFVYLHNELEIPCRQLNENEVNGEIQRFEQAVQETCGQITDVREKVACSLGEGEAHIFDAHLLVLEDRTLIDEVLGEVRRSRKNVEHCYDKVIRHYITSLNSMEDEYLKERATDIQDVSRRLIHNLIGLKKVDLSHLDENTIIVARYLTPSDTADLGRDRLPAFVTDTGGKTSHSVIMARSLGIPAVVGLHDATNQIRSGDSILVDGYNGLVVINPTESRLLQSSKITNEHGRLETVYRSAVSEPSATSDGHQISLMANIEEADDMKMALKMGADGVGLFRTEGLFLRHQSYPSEETQYQEYVAVARATRDQPVVVRTLDVGGDKTIDGFEHKEDNTFMGFRGIRFCLGNPEVFKNQLRAILRASAEGPLRIMYPMISGLPELDEANQILALVKDELRAEGQPFNEAMQVGAMVEIPSAAMIIDLLATKADFLSIGTNDLIQYLIAVDRLNDKVAHLYQPAHPAVLRTLKGILDAGKLAGIPVGICGEMAGDPIYASLLLGMGADSLSMGSNLLPEVKYLIRKRKKAEILALTEEVLQMTDPASVVNRLKAFREETISLANA